MGIIKKVFVLASCASQRINPWHVSVCGYMDTVLRDKGIGGGVHMEPVGCCCYVFTSFSHSGRLDGPEDLLLCISEIMTTHKM